MLRTCPWLPSLRAFGAWTLASARRFGVAEVLIEILGELTRSDDHVRDEAQDDDVQDEAQDDHVRDEARPR